MQVSVIFHPMYGFSHSSACLKVHFPQFVNVENVEGNFRDKIFYSSKVKI